ncbi:unnamed protein product, partial [Leptidea sinapis]
MALKVFIALALFGHALAEAPIGNGYSAGLQHSDVEQHSLSQEYGQPAFGSRSSGYEAKSRLSQEYGTPNTRSTSAISETYSVPKSGLSQKFGRSSYNSPNLSQSYGVPKSVSQEYGVPEFNSVSNPPLTSYDTPIQKSLSHENGVPLQRNFASHSEKYGAPSFQKSHATVSRSYGAPNRADYGRSGLKAAAATRSSLSESNGAPVRSLSTQYGAPNSRNFESYASPKSSYLPSQFDSYSARNNALSAQYGLPEKNSNAVISSYASLRSNPSEKYGPPASKMPSEEYGAPDVYNSQSSQGYNYARNALDELLNQEPANYDFDYKVNDIVSGSDFGHKETRQENKAEGSYFVVLPDGTKQVVEYEADERGFKPRISVEPAGFQAARSLAQRNNLGLSRSTNNNAERRFVNSRSGYEENRPSLFAARNSLESDADQSGFKPRITYEDQDSEELTRSGYDANANNYNGFGRQNGGHEYSIIRNYYIPYIFQQYINELVLQKLECIHFIGSKKIFNTY